MSGQIAATQCCKSMPGGRCRLHQARSCYHPLPQTQVHAQSTSRDSPTPTMSGGQGEIWDWRSPGHRSLDAELLRAMGSIHACSVLHCDVHAGNILVTPSSRVMLLDFGHSEHPAAAQDLAGEFRRLETILSFQWPHMLLRHRHCHQNLELSRASICASTNVDPACLQSAPCWHLQLMSWKRRLSSIVSARHMTYLKLASCCPMHVGLVGPCHLVAPLSHLPDNIPAYAGSAQAEDCALLNAARKWSSGTVAHATLT